MILKLVKHNAMNDISQATKYGLLGSRLGCVYEHVICVRELEMMCNVYNKNIYHRLSICGHINLHANHKISDKMNMSACILVPVALDIHFCYNGPSWLLPFYGC